MDIGDLLILLLFLLPFLSRLFGKKEPPVPNRQRPAPRPDGTGGVRQTDVEDPLGEALRQIREALGEAEPERPPSSPKPLPEKPRAVTKQPTRPTKFRKIGAYEHEEHGFGLSNPLSEEVFERQPSSLKRGTTDHIKQKPLESVDLSTPIEVKRVAGGASRTSPADVLRDPRRAREAFVMKEVLGPPRSLRPRR
jgi:hypothetical protein